MTVRFYGTVKLAKQLPEYLAFIDLYGVGETIAAKLIGEIGDVRRFSNKRALTAYAGVDPGKNDSGTKCPPAVKFRVPAMLYCVKPCFKRSRFTCLTRPPMSRCTNFLTRNAPRGNFTMSI
jgi:hypothetical protein